MYKKIFNICVAISLLLVGVLLIRKYFFKSWTLYYQEKLYKEPRPLLIKSLSYFKNSFDAKKALDLGAGAGNDAAYLLKQGWKVWANDAEQEAINIIAARHDIQPYLQNVTLLAKKFNVMRWDDLPQFDLIYAGYSLPFATPFEFKKIWHHLVKAIKEGGIFAGHFFGSDHSTFNWWTRRNMTFFSKQELLNLFDGFQIESFKELHEKNEQGIWEHSYEVIARRLV